MRDDLLTAFMVKLNDVLYDAGLTPEENLRTDYSGRGMCGKTCIGVTLSSSEVAAFWISVGQTIISLQNNDRDELAREFENLGADYATDNMGLDMIIYFPRVQAPESEHTHRLGRVKFDGGRLPILCATCREIIGNAKPLEPNEVQAGDTISVDGGSTWYEASMPPAYLTGQRVFKAVTS